MPDEHPTISRGCAPTERLLPARSRKSCATARRSCAHAHTKGDVELHGQTIPPGIGAAGGCVGDRDAAISDPDRFDITRDPTHLGSATAVTSVSAPPSRARSADRLEDVLTRLPITAVQRRPCSRAGPSRYGRPSSREVHRSANNAAPSPNPSGESPESRHVHTHRPPFLILTTLPVVSFAQPAGGPGPKDVLSYVGWAGSTGWGRRMTSRTSRRCSNVGDAESSRGLPAALQSSRGKSEACRAIRSFPTRRTVEYRAVFASGWRADGCPPARRHPLPRRADPRRFRRASRSAANSRATSRRDPTFPNDDLVGVIVATKKQSSSRFEATLHGVAGSRRRGPASTRPLLRSTWTRTASTDGRADGRPVW